MLHKKYSETCLNWTLNNPRTCLNQTQNNPKTCLNQTLNNPKTCLKHALNNTKTCLKHTLNNTDMSKAYPEHNKTCLNKTHFKILLYQFKCILNLSKSKHLSKPNTCLHQAPVYTKYLSTPNKCLKWTPVYQTPV